MKDRIVNHFGRAAEKQIRNHPRAAQKLLGTVFRGYGKGTRYFGNKQDLKARDYLMDHCNERMADTFSSKKDSVLISIFTPTQVFHALDMDIMFPEGLACYMSASHCQKIFLDEAEADGVPESYCSFHKQVIGMAAAGILPKPSCIVNTTMVCDANQLTFRYLADYFHVPHFVIDVPNYDNPKNRRYVAEQMLEMASFCEEVTGRSIDSKKLRKIMERSKESIANYRKIIDLKADRHETTKVTYHLMDSFAYHPLLGTKGTLEYSRRMIRDLEKLPPKRTGVRILWIHVIPFWQKSMAQIFNYNDRVEVVSCDMTFDHLHTEIDPSRPYESMAEMVLSDSFNGPAERRIDTAIEYAKRMKADGVLYFCHWGCKQTLGSAAIAKERFEAAGLPTLTLDGDGSDSRNIQDGQMVTRAGAFIEQLEASLSKERARL